MSAMRKLVPAPRLSAMLLLLWLLLARDAGPAQVVLGLVLALAVPAVTVKLRLSPARIRRPGRAARFLLRIIGDVVVSNLQVGRDVMRLRRQRPVPRFVVIPLDLNDPLGLAVLAIVTTIVPGTVWSELAADRNAMLLHVWDAPDAQAFVARFKTRYEQPLREIFE